MTERRCGKRLLVADDERQFGALIKEAGEGSGFEVFVIEDADHLAASARTLQPTVVMLDLELPGADRTELLRLLAANRSNAHVVISNGADGNELEAAMKCGREQGLRMSGMVAKPARLETLSEMLSWFDRAPA